MTAPAKEDIQKQITEYYRSHYTSGTKVEVSVGEITEAEDGGHIVNAGVKFLRKSSGDQYETKITLPFREGALDWTSVVSAEAAEEHEVGPGQDPAVPEKGRQAKAVPQPPCCEKPKEAKPFEGDPGEYIQEPAKVGSTSESRGGDEWLAESEAHTPDPDADPDDLQPEDNPTIFEETGLSESHAMASLMAFRQHSDPVASGLGTRQLVEGAAFKTVAEEPEFEPTDVALLEYHGKRESDEKLYDFKLWFTKEEALRGASDLLQLLEEVEDMREDEGNVLALSVRRASEEDDPASAMILALNEAGQLQVEWEDGHEDEYLKEAGDNAGFYHKGVQTQANQPGQPELGGGQNKPGEEQGGDTKGHSGIGKQGGTGVGKTKPVKAKKKITGSKGESVQEGMQEQADLFTDIVTFDKGDEADAEPGEELPAEEPAGELDPVISELVQAQAENGLDTVLQVSRAVCDEKGIEWSDEMEQQIRDEFAAVAGEGAPEGEEEEVPPEGEEELPFGGEVEEPEETESEEKEEPTSVKLNELSEQEIEEAVSELLSDLKWIDDLNEAELLEVEPMVYAEDELEEKAKLGTGARFKALKKELGGRKDDVKDPGALAAWIGRKKWGKGRMAKMAAKGRKAASLEKDPALSIPEAKEVFELGLTDDELAALEGGSLTKSAAESLVYDSEKSKPKITEALKAVAAKRIELKEKSENDTFLGAMAGWQRIQSKKRPASPYGRVKPNTKFKGKIRVVWDDGDETWEAPGDVQSVSNPRNAMSPSGGTTKPAPVKLTKKGGEEYKMLKGLESLRKVETGGKRFLKAIEMQLKGQKFDGRLVEVLTEGAYEFEDDEEDEEAKPPAEFEEPKPGEEKPPKDDEQPDDPGELQEDLDTLSDDEVEIIAEDYGEELSVVLPDITEDIETEGE